MSVSPTVGHKRVLSAVVQKQSTKMAGLFLLGTFLGLQAFGQYTPPPPPPPNRVHRRTCLPGRRRKRRKGRHP